MPYLPPKECKQLFSPSILNGKDIRQVYIPARCTVGFAKKCPSKRRSCPETWRQIALDIPSVFR